MIQPDFDRMAEQKEAAQDRHSSDPINQLALLLFGRRAETGDYIGIQNRVLLQLAAEEIERLRYGNAELASGYDRLLKSYDQLALKTLGGA